MTEDTAAQLREQIAAALFPPVRKGQEAWEAVADAVMLVVLAQVEAAEATARRDALLKAADDWDAWPGNELAFSGWLRAQASTQGAAPPAACSCACHGPGGNDWTHVNPCCPADPQRSGGQGAEGSGLNFTPGILQAHDEAMERIRGSERAAFVTTRDAVIGAQSSGHKFKKASPHWSRLTIHEECCRTCYGLQDDPIHVQRVPGQPGEQEETL